MILSRKIPLSYVIKSTYVDFLIVAVFTAIFAVVQLYVELFTFPMAISAVLGTAISLILSFNLSLSYDRWWEARKIWGEIVNDSRALILQLQSFTSEQDSKRIEKISHYQIVWVYSLLATLRKQALDNRVTGYLSGDEYQVLNQARHKPLHINSLIKDEMKALQSLNDFQRVQIDSTLMSLVSHMGKAERIKNTVFPTEYQQVLHFSIYLFLGFLSISLANLGHHWETLLLTILAAPFFLLEKTASHLQDPFENLPTDVPIASISRNIEINILSLLGASDIPDALEPNGFYLS